MKTFKSVSLLITLAALCSVVSAEVDADGHTIPEAIFDKALIGAATPSKQFSLDNYRTRIDDPLMCYTSHTDQCAWKKANYDVDIFNKVATDEWQICEADEGTYICPTRYPGNIQWRLNSTLNAVSMEDSPFEAYKTKTTALGTNFFLSEDDLKSLNETCPVERKLKGPDKCSGSYNNAVFTQFPPFAYQACQCPERVTKIVEEVIVTTQVAVKDENG